MYVGAFGVVFVMRKTAEKLSEKAFFLLRYFNIFVNIVAVFIGDGFPVFVGNENRHGFGLT